MSQPLLLRVATWLLARLLPNDLRESLLGDLMEEYTRRGLTSPSAALRWYLRQLCVSIPPLLWLGFTRAVWLSAVAVAVIAFFAFGEIQFVIRWMISGSSGATQKVLDLMLVFPAIFLLGYLAEWIRPRSAFLLGGAVLAAVIVMQVGETAGIPFPWHRAAWYLVGPAAFLGGVLRFLQSRRASG